MPGLPLYQLRKSEVYTALSTSPDGLTPEEAAQRLELYGPNLLAEPPPAPFWRKLALSLFHPMALLLWLAGAVALLNNRAALGLVIWLVVLINGSFSFWREYRAGQAVNSLKHLLPAYARLVRGGQEVHLPTSEIVPGDILVLAEGDNIPADARLVEEYGLRTNNASLTGESLPARKLADASLRDDLSELERPNLLFAGTSVVSGTGRAVVYATGMLTQCGRIANLTLTVKEAPGPLQQQMARLTRLLSIAALATGLIVFVVAYSEVSMPIHDAFILAIGILVATIPEGLTATVTLTLAMAVQRLAQHNVLVKKLSIVDTLGTISLICTDKSGTLTQNQMTVRKLWVANTRIDVSGVGYQPKGSFSPALSGLNGHPDRANLADVQMLFKAALLCNNARLNPPSPEQPHWSALGDQTEAALRVVALKGGLDEQEQAEAYPRLYELPFDARRKRMSTIHSSDGCEIVFVKGAPKEVLQLCSFIQIHGQVLPLDNSSRAAILSANDSYARSALRVLALAYRELPARQAFVGRSEPYTVEKIEKELVFIGLAAMMDPPRPEVAQAVQELRAAGIRIAMITGDYGLTAESLARRIGMLAGESPRIMTGAELECLGDEELNALLAQEIIFARMAPEHKLRLVGAYQKRGEVVAVIGDGVNDVPALRKADVGIAMGLTGTDVAKEAANVILTSDNFETVVRAIEEGRTAYQNLRKFITYIMASNVPEVLPFILTALFKLPLALTVAQILAIDLGTDLFPALALGMDTPEPGIMLLPPRRRDQPLVDSQLIVRACAWLGMIEAVLCYTGFFFVYYMYGYPLWVGLPSGIGPGQPLAIYTLATTTFYAGVVMCQIGNAFACRSETRNVRHMGWLSNRFLLIGIAIEIGMILSMIYIHPLAVAFEHRPLPPNYWLGLVLFAPLLYGIERVRKSIFRLVSNLNQVKNRSDQGVAV
ncbi:MAG TPA: cation-transporting P-type ATPase [Anaerolineaceae bacterium]|nr:cation-transporting P-type ATPase [Anaerolineaceae bacterium]